MSPFVLQITAGTGPVEVRRFVALLSARLLGECAARGLGVDGISYQGEEQSPRSVEMVLLGDAPLLLSGEVGTHALVARSPDRGRAARKRWFAGVSIHPLDPEVPAVDIDPRDLEITATLASGPGGQHVNNTATAVRVRHLPSGITVRISDERSQRANVKRALARLSALLARAEEEKHRARAASRRLTHYRIERGAPVRTYAIGAREDLVARAP